MKTINAVVIDSDFSQVRNIKKFFENNLYVNIVKDFLTGDEALKYLVKESASYDVIIMDTMLPGIDGETILEEIASNHLNKKVVIISKYQDDYIMKNSKYYNIISYYLKPFNLNSLEKRITDSYKTNALMASGEDNLELVVYNVLHDLGIPSNLKGYNYLYEGIMLKYKDSSLLYITKDLYPRIAEKFKTKVDNVERNIRHAIEVGTIRGNIDFINEVFKNTKHFEKSKPTNAEFICTVVERIKIDSNIR